MVSFSLPALLVFLGGVAILIYWVVSEYRQSGAKAQQSQHPRLVRILIRLLMPLAMGLGLLQLLNIIVWPLPLPSGVRELMQAIGVGLFWVGVLLSVWARQSLGRNWAHAADYQVFAGQQLVQSGPYAYIRHPMYLAFCLLFVGIELFVSSWLVVLALPLAWYFMWQAQKEEVLLAQKFGAAYRAYQAKTSRFIPGLY